MTYLSRLILNPHSRTVQRDLANCQEMHRTILRAFPDSGGHGRAAFGVLFRVEDADVRPWMLAQSSAQPDWERLPGGYLAKAAECKPIDRAIAGLAEGQRLVFRLRANPTKRVLREEGQPPGGRGWIGKRVNLTREADQIEWLGRKGTLGGFELLAVRTGSEPTSGRRTPYTARPSGSAPVPAVQVQPGASLHGLRGGARLSFGSVLFEGVLRVTDSQAFCNTLTGGIGSGKAYGFGLLSIAPARTSP